MPRIFLTALTALIICACTFSAYAAQEFSAEEAIKQSRTAVEQENFDKALEVMKQARKTWPDNAEVAFQYVRVLNWSGQRQAAQNEIDQMPESWQKNPDLKIIQGYLHYHHKDYDQAKAEFQSVLSEYPDYSDAQTGLEIVERAQTKGDREEFKWQVDTGVLVSDFSRVNQKNWNQSFVNLSRFLNERKTVISGGIERYDRFSDIDTVYNARIAQRFSDISSGYIGAYTSPHADSRPDWQLQAGGRYRINGENSPISGSTPVWLTLDTKRTLYETTDIWDVNPGIAVQPYEGWEAQFKIIMVDQDEEKRVYGQEVRIRGQITDSIKFIAGFASAPETVAGTTVDTDTEYGALGFDLDEAHTLYLGYTRDDRENSYIRNEYNVSLSYRF